MYHCNPIHIQLLTPPSIPCTKFTVPPALLTGLTVGRSHPAGQALLVAVLVAGVVAELVVSRPAQLGARAVVVVVVALHPESVVDGGCPAVPRGRVPLAGRLQDARVGRQLDHFGCGRRQVRSGQWGSPGQVRSVEVDASEMNEVTPTNLKSLIPIKH